MQGSKLAGHSALSTHQRSDCKCCLAVGAATPDLQIFVFPRLSSDMGGNQARTVAPKHAHLQAVLLPKTIVNNSIQNSSQKGTPLDTHALSQPPTHADPPYSHLVIYLQQSNLILSSKPQNGRAAALFVLLTSFCTAF